MLTGNPYGFLNEILNLVLFRDKKKNLVAF